MTNKRKNDNRNERWKSTKVKTTRAIVVLMTKLENSKVSKIVAMSAVNKEDKRPNQVAPRIDFKEAVQPSKNRTNLQSTRLEVRNASKHYQAASKK